MKPLNTRNLVRGTRSSQTFTTSLALLFAFSLASNAQLIQVGETTGGNTQLSATKSYTYNFGVTSAAGAGLVLDQLGMTLGAGSQVNGGVTISIYQGFGGSEGATNVLLSQVVFAKETFNLGANANNYMAVSTRKRNDSGLI